MLSVDEIINKEREEKSGILKLSKLGIENFPEIWDMDWLEELYLDGNEIQTIPREVKKLTDLVYLDLSKNKLRKLPHSISRLDYLEELNLSGNLGIDLDEFFFNFKQLQKLNLSETGLTYLSDRISNLQSLNDLNISNNEIEILPSALFSLLQLEKLDCSANKLKEFLFFPFSLTVLKKLLLSNNTELINISDNFTEDHELKFVDLENNSLTKIPSSLLEIEGIDIKLDGNPIFKFIYKINEAKEGKFDELFLRGDDGEELEEFPMEILEMKWLKKLDLSNNKIAVIPPEICALKNLEELFLENNSIEILPYEMQGLSKLQTLDISNNYFKRLPTCGFKWEELLNLYAKGNKISKLSFHKSDLENLVVLDVSNNSINELPKEMFNLRLEKLFLQGNRLRELDGDIIKLKTLKELDLSENLIGVVPKVISRMKNLKKIFLNGNFITNFYFDKGDFGGVEDLGLERNGIEEISDNFTLDDGLKSIKLDENFLNEIPRTVNNPSRMKEVIVSDENTEKRVVVCYSKEDSKYAYEFKKYLSVVGVQPKDFYGAEAGEEIGLYVRNAIKEARIAILMFSIDFMEDENIDLNCKMILERKKSNKIKIIKMYVRPCLLSPSYDDIVGLKGLNEEKNSVAKMKPSEQEEFWTESTRAILKMLTN